MKHKDIVDYCGKVANQHIKDMTEKEYLDHLTVEYSLGKYAVASYIRDHTKDYNFVQKLAIKLFNI